MTDQELVVFSSLLREAYFRATGEVDLPASLTESQANTLAQVLFDATGRSISGRTLRTYFRNATNAGESAKVSNPSPYHLETLARYVLQVASDHNNENADNHSIWFQYKQAWNRRSDAKPTLPTGRLNDTPKKRRYRISLLLILLLIFGSIYWRLFCPGAPVTKGWTEEFKHTNPDSLRSNGWMILDYDTLWFDRQVHKDSMLTLWTLPGDYWVKKGESAKITNMLVRKVEGDCFSVTMNTSNFYPYQNHQTVALFLFDKDLNRKTWFNFNIHFNSAHFDSNGATNLAWIYRENGENVDSDLRTIVIEGDDPTQYQFQWLRLNVNLQEINILNKAPYAWKPYTNWHHPVHVNFIPRYIGLAAFQGWTRDDGTPKGADVIPAFIEAVNVESCTR